MMFTVVLGGLVALLVLVFIAGGCFFYKKTQQHALQMSQTDMEDVHTPHSMEGILSFILYIHLIYRYTVYELYLIKSPLNEYVITAGDAMPMMTNDDME